ncbi:hypothetical protein [Actinomadura craniellae]|nr:hypothetical protein [Actinomadura craniellae]
MNCTTIRPTSIQTIAWPIGAAVFAGIGVLDVVSSSLVLSRETGTMLLGFRPPIFLPAMAMAALYLVGFRVDRRRGITMRDGNMVVTGCFGTKSLAYEEISHTEVFRRLGSSRLALHLANGRRVVLGAPRHGGLEPDARFTEKVAAIEGELGRHTRPGGTPILGTS